MITKKLLTSILLLNSILWGGYLTPVVQSTCNPNIKYVYYETPTDANYHYHNDIRYSQSYPKRNIFKPIWDIRYVNPVSTYIRNFNASWTPKHYLYTGLDARTGYKNTVTGTYASRVDASKSVTQTECIQGALAGGTTINLYDAPNLSLTYAGPQSTFIYQFGDYSIRPWNSNGTGNYMMQGRFDNPLWGNWSGHNLGGEVNFIFYLTNMKTHHKFSYVITIYGAGKATKGEDSTILYDPTTGIHHVSTAINSRTVYAKKSPWSKSTSGPRRHNATTFSHTEGRHWSDFYRVNVSYNNLKAALSKVAGFNWYDRNPAYWAVENSGIQFELEESGGEATLSGSFWNFKTYMTDKPL